MQRRHFLKTAAAFGATTLILPHTKLFGAGAPGNQLNIALIAVAGRATAHFKAVSTENVVALCDVDEEHLAGAAKKWPNAKTYVDWRKLLDDHKALALDAIVCCTADHTHAFIANWAMNRGLHVYMEKPIANCVEEARVVRATYLKNKDKLATQCGTQRHAIENFNRVRELVRDGAIGELQEVSAWGNREIPKPGYLPAAGEPPKHLHYDLWLGPSPFHPYNPGYFYGCLKWNMYWDFGSGQIGDMGSHTMDLAWNAVDTTLPISAEGKGDPFNPEVTPVKLVSQFEMPANDWRPAIRLSWHQGGAMPDSPSKFIDLKQISHGVMFEGSQGYLIADFNNRMLFPQGKKADLTYYKPRTKETLIPPLGDFQEEWIKACKGSLKTSCDFKYSTDLIETMLLGLVAYRVGKKIRYDGNAGRVTDNAEADALLKRTYRPGWTLNG